MDAQPSVIRALKSRLPTRERVWRSGSLARWVKSFSHWENGLTTLPTLPDCQIPYACAHAPMHPRAMQAES